MSQAVDMTYKLFLYYSLDMWGGIDIISKLLAQFLGCHILSALLIQKWLEITLPSARPDNL